MSPGELQQVSKAIYAYLQPDGNYLFGGATIVGHERCREAILATSMPPPPGIWTDVDWGDLEPAPPFLTYTDA
jgi:cyclase